MADQVHDIGGGNVFGPLARQLREAATRAWIEEDFRSVIVSSTAEAIELATGLAEQKSLTVIKRPGGQVDVGDYSDFEWYDTSYWPRDSKAWQDVYDSFDWVVENLEKFPQYDYQALAAPIAAMDSVVSGLGQGGLSGNAEEISSRVEVAVANQTTADLKDLLTDDSEWKSLTQVSSVLADWTGLAAEVFKLAYADRLPIILVGQLAVAMALRETLEVAQAVFKGAQQDAIDLARANVDALEGAGVDVNWTQVLKTVSEVSLKAKTLTASIPHPGVQMFSKIAGYVSQGSGLAATIVAKFETNTGSSEPKLEIGSGSVDQIMGVFASQLNKIHEAVASVEQAAAEVMNEFYALVTSTASGSKIWLTTSDPIVLTLREAYFEPKAPAAAEGHGGPGLATLGGDLTDDRPGNDPTFETLRNNDVMGPPTATGAIFGANLYSLHKTGNTLLPDLAAQYGSLAGNTGNADTGVEGAFSRDVLVAGGSQTGTGTGALYPAWTQLHEELLAIFAGSATNLEQVGVALVFVAQAYAEQDDAAAAEFRAINHGVLPWE